MGAGHNRLRTTAPNPSFTATTRRPQRRVVARRAAVADCSRRGPTMSSVQPLRDGDRRGWCHRAVTMHCAPPFPARKQAATAPSAAPRSGPARRAKPLAPLDGTGDGRDTTCPGARSLCHASSAVKGLAAPRFVPRCSRAPGRPASDSGRGQSRMPSSGSARPTTVRSAGCPGGSDQPYERHGSDADDHEPQCPRIETSTEGRADLSAEG